MDCGGRIFVTARSFCSTLSSSACFASCSVVRCVFFPRSYPVSRDRPLGCVVSLVSLPPGSVSLRSDFGWNEYRVVSRDLFSGDDESCRASPDLKKHRELENP